MLEAAMVLGGRHPERAHEVDALLALPMLRIEPFGVHDAEVARSAVLRFGKGSGHPARLNYGDCMSYAVVKARRLPLLFKGDDFRHTDMVAAI